MSSRITKKPQALFSIKTLQIAGQYIASSVSRIGISVPVAVIDPPLRTTHK
jgi:hypothetical protein